MTKQAQILKLLSSGKKPAEVAKQVKASVSYVYSVSSKAKSKRAKTKREISAAKRAPYLRKKAEVTQSPFIIPHSLQDSAVTEFLVALGHRYLTERYRAHTK